MVAIPFNDNKRWGSFFFTDFLDINDVQHSYDGKILTFGSEQAKNRAEDIWQHLTGSRDIGVVG